MIEISLCSPNKVFLLSNVAFYNRSITVPSVKSFDVVQLNSPDHIVLHIGPYA